MSRRNLDSKVYVGDLPRDATEKEIERAFTYYGPLRSVWVARNPPGFAFVEFEDDRDAEDAVKGLDGSHVCGVRVRVEHSTGRVRPKPWAREGGGGGGGGGGRGGGGGGGRAPFNPNDRCYECGEYGHYAYDCRERGGAGGGRSSSSGRRRYSRSRSRSPRRQSSRRQSYTPSRSRSPRGRDSRSRSRSPARNGDRD